MRSSLRRPPLLAFLAVRGARLDPVAALRTE